jgi:hypothetical protein
MGYGVANYMFITYRVQKQFRKAKNHKFIKIRKNVICKQMFIVISSYHTQTLFSYRLLCMIVGAHIKTALVIDPFFTTVNFTVNSDVFRQPS